ncbi:unnamed protein product, partial [marine sediment metagenome]
ALGEFMGKEGKIIFTVKKGTILNAHIEKVDKKIDFKKLREQMEKDIAENVIRKMK